MSEATFVVTCEHAGNRVPAPYASLFAAHGDLLRSHRGWDAGALELARDLSARLGAPLVATDVSRLVVDCNRSLRHPRLFSPVTRALDAAERRRIVDRWWRPFREEAERRVRAAGARVVHVSAHSFTPVLDGTRRDVDVGFLYDPSRTWERALVAGWCGALRKRRPDLRVRRNAPYRGTADGHTTALRRRQSGDRYAGIEVEVSQALTLGDERAWSRLRGQIVETLITT